MRFLFSICFISTLLLSSVCYSQSLDWAYGVGSSGPDRGVVTKTDFLGNVFTTGYFSGTVDFDPSNEVDEISADDDGSCFITKFDVDGNYLWTIGLDLNLTFWDGVGLELAIDPEGNVLLSGSFSGSTDFDPSATANTLTSEGDADVFLAKYNSLGELQWVSQMTTTALAFTRALKVDENGSIFLTGVFYGSMLLGSENELVAAEESNIFLLKFTEGGSLNWAFELGDEGSAFATDFSFFSDGSIVMTGFLIGEVDFDPTEGQLILESVSSLYSSPFIASYSQEGELQNANVLENDGLASALSIETDISDNIVIGGSFSGNLSLDDLSESPTEESNGGRDVFVVKYNSDGDYLWSENYGSTEDDEFNSLVVNGGGDIIISCSVGGPGFDINPSGEVSEIIPPSQSSISCYDGSGAYKWGGSIGNASFSDQLIVSSMEIGGDGELYVTGFFDGEASFSILSDSSLLSSVNSTTDIFLSKYFPCMSSSITREVYACDSLVSPDGDFTWTESGLYETVLLNAAGCDSTIATDLTILTDSPINQEVESCDGYLWPLDSLIYEESGTYFKELYGCESDTAFLELTMNDSYTLTETVESCGDYFWEANGQIYDESGSYTALLSTTAGCDSTLMLDLEITNVDTVVTVDNITLEANAENATYQWLDCDDSFSIIEGETSQTFTPEMDGNYAVQITQNDCSDTSSCFLLTDVGIQSIYLDSGMKIYPNPTTGKVYLQLEKNAKQAKYSLFTFKGQLLKEKSIDKQIEEVDLRSYESGVYNLRLEIDSHVIHRRIVKY